MIKFGRKSGVYPEFSNFHDTAVAHDEVVYRNNECAFQAQKTLDKEDRLRFCNMSGNQAKKAGRDLVIRIDWESVKYQIMVELCYDKFNRDQKLKELLLSTGNDWIVEDTTGWHDNRWGTCSCCRCINKFSSNMLGRSLMTARSMIRGDIGVPVKIILSGKEFDFDLLQLPTLCGDAWYSTLDKINRCAE